MINRLLLLPFFVLHIVLIAGQPPSVIFHASFDSTLSSTEGEDPTLSLEVSFVEGIQGKGVYLGEGAVLQYPRINNIDARTGSLSMWVQPDWDPGVILHRIMVLGKDPRNFELHVDEGGNLAFAVNTWQVENKPIKVFLSSVNNWTAGAWYFLTFNWNNERIEVFIDGRKIGSTELNFEIPEVVESVFHLGSLDGGEPFLGTFDEVKIYDGPLSEEAINANYEQFVTSWPLGYALSLTNLFGQDVTTEGITLVDWEGPIRNPAMKYFISGSDDLDFPLSVTLSTTDEQSYFNAPSNISPKGASKTLVLDSATAIDSFFFSIYMDDDFLADSFDLTLTYRQNNLPVRQVVPVYTIDQDYNRPLSYPTYVDFSESAHPLFQEEIVQAIIRRAMDDWAYYIDGEGMDLHEVGTSRMMINNIDETSERIVFNKNAFKGFYLFVTGTDIEDPCICSTGFPSQFRPENLQTRMGEVLPFARIGGHVLNVLGNFSKSGYKYLMPDQDWTYSSLEGKTDLYGLAKHEIGHAFAYEFLPLYNEAADRGYFSSPNLTEYYQDTIFIPPESLHHIVGAIDPASLQGPYAAGNGLTPGGREMLTKLDLYIMESIGYPIRESGATTKLNLQASPSLAETSINNEFSSSIFAVGGVPVYFFDIVQGALPAGLSLDENSGEISGTPNLAGIYPITFRVRDYSNNHSKALLETVITVTDQSTFTTNMQSGVDFVISPNPAHTHFVATAKLSRITKLSLELVDIHGSSGDRIKLGMHKNARQVFNHIDLPAGIYLMRLWGDGQILSVRKLVIQ